MVCEKSGGKDLCVMKISVVFGGSCALPPEAIGAIEILWTDIGKILAQRGHSVVLIGKGSLSFPRAFPNVTFRLIEGFSPSSSRFKSLWMAFRACWQMLKLLDETDVLVPNNVWGAWLAKVFFRYKFKAIVANVARMPKGLYRFRNAGLAAYACPTSAVAERVRAQLPAGDRSHVVVVPNPIDTNYFNVRQVKCCAKTMEIAYHGRINREKGLHLLAAAVEQLAEQGIEIGLKLIGSYDVGCGGSGVEYKRELDEISGGRIKWVGAIADRGELAEAISECLIYCYPSIAERGETFGVAPLEAMGLGMPVIVSALECFRDFVDDGETGLIFDHRAEDPVRSLVEKIKLLLDEETLRRKIGSAGAMRAEDFSNERIAERYEHLFKEVCE